MVDLVEVLITGAPLIIVALISAVGGFLFDRLKPKTTGEKVDEFKSIKDSYRELSEEYKKSSDENKRKFEETNKKYEDAINVIHELQIDMEKIKGELRKLSDCGRRYKKLKIWAKDVWGIAERNNIILPNISPEIADEIKSIDDNKRNYVKETLNRGKKL